MRYWLVKTDPEAYSWNDFVSDAETTWDGVRNYQARNNLREMNLGDQVIVYHSVSDKCAMGTAEVSQTSFPDPKAPAEAGWLAVGLRVLLSFPNPVSLSAMKATPSLAGLALFKQSRLSVSPLTEEEFLTIVRLGSK